MHALLIKNLVNLNNKIIVAGLLAEPAKKYPQVFIQEGLFGQFPFLLSSLSAAVVCLIPFVLVWWLLPETLEKRYKARFCE